MTPDPDIHRTDTADFEASLKGWDQDSIDRAETEGEYKGEGERDER